MSFIENPLSLSLPQSALEAWLQERGLLDAGVLDRAYQAAQGSVFALWQAVRLNPFAELTAEDLCRPPAPWTADFWDCGTGPWDSFSWPLTVPQVKLRMQENLRRYCGNYLVLALVFFLCFLYRMPVAVLGLVALFGIWECMRLYVTSRGLTTRSYRFMALSFTGQATTWILMVYTRIGAVTLWTFLLTFLFLVLHASTRRLTPSRLYRWSKEHRQRGGLEKFVQKFRSKSPSGVTWSPSLYGLRTKRANSCSCRFAKSKKLKSTMSSTQPAWHLWISHCWEQPRRCCAAALTYPYQVVRARVKVRADSACQRQRALVFLLVCDIDGTRLLEPQPAASRALIIGTLVFLNQQRPTVECPCIRTACMLSGRH